MPDPAIEPAARRGPKTADELRNSRSGVSSCKI